MVRAVQTVRAAQRAETDCGHALRWRIAGGRIVAGGAVKSLVRGDLLVEGGRITALVPEGETPADFASPSASWRVLDATGCLVIPGLVQTHVHLCQTLFRGRADGLPLADWLAVVKGLEAGLGEDDLRRAVRVGIAELVLSGVTSCSDIGFHRFTDSLLEVAAESGIRIQSGRTMTGGFAPGRGEAVQGHAQGHAQELARVLAEAAALVERWHGAANGRVRLALIPRGVASAGDDLFRGAVQLARRHGLPIHTHCAETDEECAFVERHCGLRPVARLERLGVLDGPCQLAHCVAVNAAEIRVLAARGAHALHCPSANLKLASGIAPVRAMLEQGVNVSLGSDGTPCNNRLDGFGELRLAALVHKAGGDATAVSAGEAFAMATLNGARALGLDAETGSIEVGKRADIVVVRADSPHWLPFGGHEEPDLDLALSRLVYSACAADVDTVMVDGRALAIGGRLVGTAGNVLNMW